MANDNQNLTPNLNPNLDEKQHELEVPPNQNATNLNALNRMREGQGGQNAQAQPGQGQAGQGQPRQAQGAQSSASQGQFSGAPLEQGSQQRQQTAEQTARNESGMPGGGVGRMESPGRTGVYPVSADEGASESAKTQPEEAFGQGQRGAAGYQDSGGSEIIPPKELGKSGEEVI